MSSQPIAAAITLVPDQTGLERLTTEVEGFLDDCKQRYRFNSYWDNVLNAAGILLSVAIIAAGVWNAAKLATDLGGFVASIVTAQRAFPFGQRLRLYETSERYRRPYLQRRLPQNYMLLSSPMSLLAQGGGATTNGI
jgi:hypothetical protein